MAFLSAVIGVRDSSGVRVDSPDALGNYLPIVLKLGSNLTSSVTQSGGVSVVTISAAGASGVTSVTGTTPINSSGGATPDITIDAASGTGPGYMSPAHFSLVDGATSAATASTLAKRDADGRMKAVAGVASDDVAVVSQIGGSGLQTGADIDYASIGAGTPQDFKSGGDGTYTIGGRAHAVLNSANAAKLELDAAGLTGRATVNSGWPVIHLPLTTLAPPVSLARHEVWILARLKLSAGAPGEGTLVRMSFDYEAWAGGDQAARFNYHQAGYQSGAHYLAIGATGHEYNSFAVSSSLVASDMVVAWRLTDGGRTVQFYSLAWPGAWPSIDDLTQIASVHLRFSHFSNAWTPSSATLRLSWVDATSTLAEWSMPRIQVLYR